MICNICVLLEQHRMTCLNSTDSRKIAQGLHADVKNTEQANICLNLFQIFISVAQKWNSQIRNFLYQCFNDIWSNSQNLCWTLFFTDILLKEDVLLCFGSCKQVIEYRLKIMFNINFVNLIKCQFCRSTWKNWGCLWIFFERDVDCLSQVKRLKISLFYG